MILVEEGGPELDLFTGCSTIWKRAPACLKPAEPPWCTAAASRSRPERADSCWSVDPARSVTSSATCIWRLCWRSFATASSTSTPPSETVSADFRARWRTIPRCSVSASTRILPWSWKARHSKYSAKAVHVVGGTHVTHSNIAEAELDPTLSLHGVRLHVLGHCDRYDLHARRPVQRR